MTAKDSNPTMSLLHVFIMLIANARCVNEQILTNISCFPLTKNYFRRKKNPPVPKNPFPLKTKLEIRYPLMKHTFNLHELSIKSPLISHVKRNKKI